MIAKPTLKDPLNTSPMLSPFQKDFDPSSYAKGKSHFQLVFCSIREKWRKQAVVDFYAFCRLADDLADENDFELSDRSKALESLKSWVQKREKINHIFWDRFLEGLERTDTPSKLLLQILNGVESDLNQTLQIKTWEDLNRYSQAVAGDVGEVVLHLIGAWTEKAPNYAAHLGRCVQYLNILRDLEEDFEEGRVYVPEESLRLEDKNSWAQFEKEIQRLRKELYHRAIEYRSAVQPYSWKCFPSEMMVNFYLIAAQKYWSKGYLKKLSRFQKIRLFVSSFYRSFWACKNSST